MADLFEGFDIYVGIHLKFERVFFTLGWLRYEKIECAQWELEARGQGQDGMAVPAGVRWKNLSPFFDTTDPRLPTCTGRNLEIRERQLTTSHIVSTRYSLGN